MPPLGRAGRDESAVALVVHERVLGCREYAVACGGDGGSDVVVSREDGDGHDGRREGGTEDEVDGRAAVSSVVCYVGPSRGYVCAYVVPGIG